uniref:Uncharacterized protein n=1 Tax=Candidatus Kentrum sp. TC TaxID=2126339 RepID=A0A450YN27_9GAMM|nr:MAG: Protein of unknown function (DUF1020) [Candidatus Kentron sp. TC]VFK57280.1 MAG: Protein of unknown function (DUF1020) [Candidatus Kentron sp. TC]
MSKRARMIRGLLFFIGVFSFVSAFSAQQDISTDPFLQDQINRQHWAPGGQHYPSYFPVRGPVIEQTGQVDIHPLHTQRLGNYKLQNADVRGEYGFVIDLRSQHGHNVHSPFDYASEATKRFREDRKDGGQSSIEVTSQGRFVHPANGYDPPAGGGFPPPDPRGAIDLANFSISGFATGVYPLSISEQQKSDIAPGLSVDALADRVSNSFDQGSGSFAEQFGRAGQGIAEASDALFRGDSDNGTGAGQRLRDFGNGVADSILGAVGSVVYGASGFIVGAFEPEVVAARTKIGNAAVTGFKAVDIKTQYTALQASSDLENLLETYPEIGKIVEGSGLFVGGSIAKKAFISKVKVKRPIWSKGRLNDSVQNSLNHWKKHQKEFPTLQNAKQYVEAVHDFTAKPPKGTFIKTRKNGDKLFYDPNSNTFAIINERGAPRTMFKPKNGIKYWKSQTE